LRLKDVIENNQNLQKKNKNHKNKDQNWNLKISMDNSKILHGQCDFYGDEREKWGEKKKR
jgi:hypothetical protein